VAKGSTVRRRPDVNQPDEVTMSMPPLPPDIADNPEDPDPTLDEGERQPTEAEKEAEEAE
jgi:hypothetical protein